MEQTATETQSPVVSASGRFDAYSAPDISHQIGSLLDDGVVEVWVDLSETEFIDSTALADLVRHMKRARAAGGELTLWKPSDAVRVILELTSLDLAFSVSSNDAIPGVTSVDRRG